MTYDRTTARVEHEFSTGWAEKFPETAADQIADVIAKIKASDMLFRFDFSRPGFFKIVGEREKVGA